ncbi:hypothetical protein G5S93_13245 [Legionella pneumophila serogroup 1]|uniref:hypothetical protein n=1 Tax=Legionella pneumophila TaxID=446 RepID=UPI001020747F|nr:hypothetical protein [Legionella pneumophila]HAT9682589.1 hypothetical protein [Legionella pneumophila subsp. pneumophila]MCH9100151.1 hypothetical protein [Legionella pneumophila serogroup 1]MCH9112286.1 hypothetical protein [Legionella pneumophila serogroup 1]MDW9159561.1 hypothetical protein [Legionella pneumophila]RYX29477.1 hypothetical protein D7271_14575 [Legionella pneumophila]
MGDNEYKIFLKESTNQNDGHSWWLQEENIQKEAGTFTPSKEYLGFTLKELLLIDGFEISISFDEETSNDIEKNKKQGVIHATLNIIKDYKDHQLIIFGSGCEINEFHLHINRIEQPNENSACFVKGSMDGGLSIYLTLTPTQFDNIAELIKINRLDRLELVLFEPPGFYSAPNSDYIMVLPNSKELEVVTPDNCEIKPPRLGKSYFSINAYRQDRVTKATEENDSVEDKHENFQEYKDILEKILNRLDSLVYVPLGLFVGVIIGVFIVPWLLKVGSVIKDIIFQFFS